MTEINDAAKSRLRSSASKAAFNLGLHPVFARPEWISVLLDDVCLLRGVQEPLSCSEMASSDPKIGGSRAASALKDQVRLPLPPPNPFSLPTLIWFPGSVGQCGVQKGRLWPCGRALLCCDAGRPV